MNKKTIARLASSGMLFALALVSLATARTAQASIGSQLDYGSRGSDVTELQEFLSTNSRIYPAGIVTGYFGPLTRAAVVQFQVAYDLPQAGRVGPMTREKINDIMASGLGLDTTAPVIANTLIQTNRTGATVSWTTNEVAQGQVYYDTTPLLASEATGHAQQPYVSGISAPNNVGARVSQSVAIQNLQPDTLYYYMTRAIDNSRNVSVTRPNTFRTQK